MPPTPHHVTVQTALARFIDPPRGYWTGHLDKVGAAWDFPSKGKARWEARRLRRRGWPAKVQPGRFGDEPAR